MNRYELYRAAARRLFAAMVPHAEISISDSAEVQIANGLHREDLGDGAYVEVRIWVPRAEADRT